MTEAEVLKFSALAAQSRNASYGEPCLFEDTDHVVREILVVCQPIRSQELEAGGFEKSGRMKVLCSGDFIPHEQAKLLIRDQVWVVAKKIVNSFSSETALLLEAVPVNP